MKKLALFFVGISIVYTLRAQELTPLEIQTTYPIDSCLYFMNPFNLKIIGKQTFDDGMVGLRTSFQSESGGNTDFLLQGKGRFLINPDLLPTGVTLETGDRLSVVLTLPDAIHNPDDPWSGGPLPFPVFMNGFIQEIENTSLDPPLSFTLQALQFEVISLVD